jgi:isopenicillin N synthase-like dioxygenase
MYAKNLNLYFTFFSTLQLISNDKFRSVEHRVIANSTGPRISVACFFNTRFNPAYNKLYGPLKELLTEANPPFYKETTVRDFMLYYSRKGLNGQSALDHFRL